MADVTAKHELPYPEAGDPTNVPADILALAEAVDAIMSVAEQGNMADRPAFGRQGVFYAALDKTRFFYDTGAAWLEILTSRIGSTLDSGAVTAITSTAGALNLAALTLNFTVEDRTVAVTIDGPIQADGTNVVCTIQCYYKFNGGARVFLGDVAKAWSSAGSVESWAYHEELFSVPGVYEIQFDLVRTGAAGLSHVDALVNRPFRSRADLK